ncbi:hypothetical protein ACP4OV_003591 [Aristida adscensionis]
MKMKMVFGRFLLPMVLAEATRSRAHQISVPQPPSAMALSISGAAAEAAAAKLSISGAALAALLHRCAAAAGDCDGLLSGRASLLPAPPPSLSDYDDPAASAPPAPALAIAVSGHSSLSRPSSLAGPLGGFQPPSASAPPPVGFFSSRRRAAPRPSMRELALAHSLARTLAPAHPLVFLLVAPSASPDHAIHSYDYRAYLLLGSRLVPASLTVVNAGPGLWDQYHSFAAESPFPWLSASPAPDHAHTIGEQKAVDDMVDGFGIARVQEVVGSAAGQAAEMDGMYAGMLRRLEKLAREVEKSNLRVLEQRKSESAAEDQTCRIEIGPKAFLGLLKL